MTKRQKDDIIMEYGKNLFLESDILELLAKESGKSVIHVKAVGVLENPEMADETWEFYFGKIPLNLLNILMQYKEAYCFLETTEALTHAFEEWFPKKHQLLDDEMHFFVQIHAVSADGMVNAVND